MRNVRQLTLFLASPGDVSKERAIVHEVVEAVNRSVGASASCRIEVVGWETHASPDYGADGQEIINQQIGQMEDYDFFVGLMWNRFGSPTPRSGSGTQEEFERAVASFEQRGTPRIMMYFSQAPSTLTTTEELAQRGEILAFRSRLQQRGLWHEYRSVDEFKEAFRQHITQALLRLSQADTMVVVPSTTRTATPTPMAPTSWSMLNGRFFEAVEVTERGESVKLTVKANSSAEDESLRALGNSRSAAPFAFQDQAGIADILGCERSSGPKGDVWTVDLRLQKTDSLFMEMAYNGRSSLELAEMRARYVLLNEQPNPSDPFLATFVIGRVAGRNAVDPSAFKSLWVQLGRDAGRFLPLARLLAVYDLKSTGTVAQIVRLELGPIKENRMEVSFEGIRGKYYANTEPDHLTVEGICTLE